jgi:fermentation-respiration switch protein FrsA (DUF1100 family)
VQKSVVSGRFKSAGFQPSVPALLEAFPAAEQAVTARDVALPGFERFVAVGAVEVRGALAFRGHEQGFGWSLGGTCGGENTWG